MDILFFILIILALVAAFWFLHVSEYKTKDKHKIAAYNLLEEKNPDPKKIKQTITALRLYGGRFRKDHEFSQLQIMLSDLLDETENPVKTKRPAKE